MTTSLPGRGHCSTGTQPEVDAERNRLGGMNKHAELNGVANVIYFFNTKIVCVIYII